MDFVSSIAKTFNISRSKAREVSRILNRDEDPVDLLEEVNDFLGLYGVEAISDNYSDVLYYINTGDLYTPTVFFYTGDIGWKLGTVADYMEENQERFGEEEEHEEEGYDDE